MKKLNIKKIVAVTLIALMIQGQAGAGGLQDMWMSNVTTGGALDTTNRHGLFGGSIAARTPIVAFAPINFTPPHASAGCGGVDLYMGSFSFVSKAQVVSMFKAIMNNATGLLFKAAIKLISPATDSVLTDIQTMMGKLSQMQMNSCQIATAGVDWLSNAKEKGFDEANKELANSKAVSDIMVLRSDPSSVTSAQIKAAEKDSPSVANVVWKALRHRKSEQFIDFGMFPAAPVAGPGADLARYQREILMSFVGAVSDSLEEGAADGSSPRITELQPAQLELTDLVKGSVGKNKITCSSTSTPGPSGNPLGEDTTCDHFGERVPLQFIDASLYVDVMLYGNPAWLATPDVKTIHTNLGNMAVLPTASVTADPSSIVGLLSGASASKKQLTAEQAKFLKIMGSKIVGLIMKLQGPEYSNIPKLQAFLQGEIVNLIAFNFADTVINAVNDVGVGRDSAGKAVIVAVLPDQIQKRIDVLKKQRIELMNKAQTDGKDFKDAMEFVDTLIAQRARELGSNS